MNAYAADRMNEYIAQHDRFTTEDLYCYIKTRSPKQAPSKREIGHYLITIPLIKAETGTTDTWRRIDLPAGIPELLRAVWRAGSLPMQELRERYGPAVDSAAFAGMILRAESRTACDYILTRRGISYMRGLTA